MSCWQKTKLIGPLLLFNILLPTWDVFSDVKLSVNLFIGGKQNCSIEDKNVQEFRQEFDLCLQNPQAYCQSDSMASYLCQENSIDLSCMKCRVYVPGNIIDADGFGDCVTSYEGIREIYDQCLIYDSDDDYCSNPDTYHGICEKVIRRHYIFAIMLLGIYEHFYLSFLYLIILRTGFDLLLRKFFSLVQSGK